MREKRCIPCFCIIVAVLLAATGRSSAAAPPVSVSVSPSELTLRPGIQTIVQVRVENAAELDLTNLAVQVVAPPGVDISGPTISGSTLGAGAADVSMLQITAGPDAPGSGVIGLEITGRSGAVPVALTSSIGYQVAAASVLTASLTKLGSNDPGRLETKLQVTFSATGTEPVTDLSATLRVGGADPEAVELDRTTLYPSGQMGTVEVIDTSRIINAVVIVEVTGRSAGREVGAFATLTGPEPSQVVTLEVGDSESFTDLSGGFVQVEVGNATAETRTICVQLSVPADQVEDGLQLTAELNDFGTAPDIDGSSMCDLFAPYETRPLTFNLDAKRGGGGDVGVLVAAAESPTCAAADDDLPVVTSDSCSLGPQKVQKIITVATSAYADTLAGKLGFLVAGFVPGVISVLAALAGWKRLAKPRRWATPSITPLAQSASAGLALAAVGCSALLALYYRWLTGVLIFARVGFVDLAAVTLTGLAAAALVLLVVADYVRFRYPVFDRDSSAEEVAQYLAGQARPLTLRSISTTPGSERLVLWANRESVCLAPMLLVRPSRSANESARNLLPSLVDGPDLQQVLVGVRGNVFSLSFASKAPPEIITEPAPTGSIDRRSVLVYGG